MTIAKNTQQPRTRTANELHRAASKRRYDQRDWRRHVVRASCYHDQRKDPQLDTACSEYLEAADLNDMIEEQNGECVYCDVYLEYGVGVNRQRDPAGLTVERVLNEYPHYRSNCVLACRGCNHARNATYTWQEFEENHEAIKAFRIKKCPTCKTMKPREEYHANRTRAGGMHGTCKICRNGCTPTPKDKK
jgi:hypothetical protein